MKKHFSIFILIFTCVLTVSAAPVQSEAELLRELNAAYESHSYPTVIEYAARLESANPDSLLLQKALPCKGESLYRLKRYQEAIPVLEKSILLNSKNARVKAECIYWKARSEYCLNKKDAALNSFAGTMEIYHQISENKKLDDEQQKFFNRSAYYSLKICGELYLNEQSVPLGEYVVYNGNNFSSEEFCDAAVILFDAYSSTGQHKKLTDLYTHLFVQQEKIPSVFDYLTLTAGDSYAELCEYKKSYDCYSAVLSGSRSDLAALALQKAYCVAAEHQVEVNENPANILSAAEYALRDYPELVAEFWTRLGIDAYNSGDYAKASVYFEKAEFSVPREYKQLIGLYRSAIALKSQKESSAQESLSFLKSYAQETNLSNTDEVYSDYELSYVRVYAYLQEWLLVKEKCESSLSIPGLEKGAEGDGKINPVFEIKYWYALACYMTGDFEKAEELIEDFPFEKEVRNLAAGKNISYNAQMLYARILCKCGKNKKALELFSKLDEKELLDEGGILDYAKVLLLEGYISSSYKQAVRVQTPDGWYLAAIASFNRKDWLTAEQYFKKYVFARNDAFTSYAYFYCGYAQYRLGKVIEAYATLSNYTLKYPGHELAWDAYILSANAALQNGSYDQAALQVESAIRNALTKEHREQAVILCASIYSDAGNYDKAIEVLEPFITQYTDFGIQCRYQKAQILSRQQKFDESDVLYKQIADKAKDSGYADDASYRRGEMFYTERDFEKAVSRFEHYRKQYPAGKYVDASYYYEADSCEQINETDRAILLCCTLISSCPESSYVYSSHKKLIQLYSRAGDYNSAIKSAEILLQQFREQAVQEGIKQQLATLKLLESGIDEELVKLRTDYELSGGLASIEGRRKGTELALELSKSQDTQEEAYALAEQLYVIQTIPEHEAEECAESAKTGLLLAQNERQKGNASAAAELFLKSAQYARQAGEDEIAQRALYGAVEAFDAEKLYADSKNTLTLMEELYPDSNYTLQAGRIAGDTD